MFKRRIKIGKQTYLCCNIKPAPCEEENGCVLCNEKHWPVIEKALHPLLLQCSSDLKDKDTTVEFYGHTPCIIDDLHLQIYYELKPKNLSFTVVQPRSDEHWRAAWNNVLDDAGRNYNNFGGLFERVCFLDYILHINVTKTDGLSNPSLSDSDNQKDNEKKSSYFQENERYELNPLGKMLKRKHGAKKQKTVVKHNNKISKQVENNIHSVNCADGLSTSSIPENAIITAAKHVTSCHNLSGDKKKKDKELEEVGNGNFEHSPLKEKQESIKLSDFPHRNATEENNCVEENITNTLDEEVTCSVISKDIKPLHDGSPIQINKKKIQSKNTTNGLLEENLFKNKAEGSNNDVKNTSCDLERKPFVPSVCHNEDKNGGMLHRNDTEFKFSSFDAKRKKIEFDSSLNDSSLSESSSWLNKLKNACAYEKYKSYKLKCRNVKSLSQTQVKTSDKKLCQLQTQIAVCSQGQKAKLFTINPMDSIESRKEKNSEEYWNSLNLRYPCNRVLQELPEDPLKMRNGDYYEECDITLPNLDGHVDAYSSFMTLEDENINGKKLISNLYSKRKLSPVSPQKIKKKLLSVDKSSFLHSSMSEYSDADTVEKDDSVSRISQSRNLFLDIVSNKKTSDTKDSPDTTFLQSDISPILKCVDDVINLDTEDVSSSKCSRLVSSLKKPQLRNIFRRNLTMLKDISSGKKYCRRHEDFMRGGKASYELTYQVNLSPFKERQLDYIMELLMSKFYVKPNEDIDYILKVLLPETLIIIFMEFHKTDHANSDRLMAEAAFNAENMEVL